MALIRLIIKIIPPWISKGFDTTQEAIKELRRYKGHVIMKTKELFVITFINDYPFSDYKKIWAYNKDEALRFFEERCEIMKECVKYIETHDEWLQSDVSFLTPE